MIILLIIKYLDLFLVKWKIKLKTQKLADNWIKLLLIPKLKIQSKINKSKSKRGISNWTKEIKLIKNHKNQRKILLEILRINLKTKIKSLLKKIKNNKEKIQYKIKNLSNLFSSLNLYENKRFIIMNSKENKNKRKESLKYKKRKRNKEKEKDNFFKSFKLTIF